MLDDKRRRYFTVAEVAEYLELSRSKIYQMVDRKEFAAHRFGGEIQISREELERLERDSTL